MKRVQTTLAAASLALASFATTATADDLATVQVFYDLLSNPGSEPHAARGFQHPLLGAGETCNMAGAYQRGRRSAHVAARSTSRASSSRR